MHFTMQRQNDNWGEMADSQPGTWKMGHNATDDRFHLLIPSTVNFRRLKKVTEHFISTFAKRSREFSSVTNMVFTRWDRPADVPDTTMSYTMFGWGRFENIQHAQYSRTPLHTEPWTRTCGRYFDRPTFSCQSNISNSAETVIILFSMQQFCAELFLVSCRTYY